MRTNVSYDKLLSRIEAEADKVPQFGVIHCKD